MAKLDERSVVPAVDDEACRRLGAALDREPVVAAYLIGSWARGTAGAMSDVDVAIWTRDRDADLALLGHLREAACQALGTQEVDLVPLAQAGPALQYAALRDGVIVVDRDHDERLRRELQALHQYWDTKPLRALYWRALRQRIDEDRFGRP